MRQTIYSLDCCLFESGQISSDLVSLPRALFTSESVFASHFTITIKHFTSAAALHEMTIAEVASNAPDQDWRSEPGEPRSDDQHELASIRIRTSNASESCDNNTQIHFYPAYNLSRQLQIEWWYNHRSIWKKIMFVSLTLARHSSWSHSLVHHDFTTFDIGFRPLPYCSCFGSEWDNLLTTPTDCRSSLYGPPSFLEGELNLIW